MAYKRKTIKDLDSAEVEVKDPTTQAPLGLIITLAGPENGKRQAIEYAVQRKMRATLQKTGKIELADPADEELDTIEKLAACTLGWKGLQDESGLDVPFSADAAQKLYTEEPWMRHQLIAALNERERFIKSSATA
jgi:hypothetical protein